MDRTAQAVKGGIDERRQLLSRAESMRARSTAALKIRRLFASVLQTLAALGKDLAFLAHRRAKSIVAGRLRTTSSQLHAPVQLKSPRRVLSLLDPSGWQQNKLSAE